MKLIPLLDSIQKSVADIEGLNAGGCAVFAALVARRLNKIGVKARVRVGDYCLYSDTKNILKNAKGNGAKTKEDFGEEGVGFLHLIVEITEGKKKYHFDSESFTTARKNLFLFPSATFYNGSLSAKECLRLARSKDWNCMFNRKQIPTLIKKLNQIFSRADEILGNNC